MYNAWKLHWSSFNSYIYQIEVNFLFGVSKKFSFYHKNYRITKCLSTLPMMQTKQKSQTKCKSCTHAPKVYYFAFFSWFQNVLYTFYIPWALSHGNKCHTYGKTRARIQKEDTWGLHQDLCTDGTKLNGRVLTSLVVLILTLSIYKIMPGPMVDLAERNWETLGTHLHPLTLSACL